MFMSISHRSALGDRASPYRHLVLLFALLVSGCAAAQSAPSSNEIEALERALRQEVGRSDVFPTDSLPAIRWLAAPRYIAEGGQRHVVGVAQIQFKRLTNSYCRLVAQVEGAPQLLVPTPESAQHDACKGVGAAYTVDLNGDGRLDYVYSVKVASNRTGNDVEDVMAFFRASSGHQPYCYSSVASRHLAPSTLASVQTLQLAAKSLATRLNAAPIVCE